jgi:hypothetical protein
LLYLVIPVPTVAIWVKEMPSNERWSANPASLVELSVQERLTWLVYTAVAARVVGGAGVGVGVGLGVGELLLNTKSST